MNISQPYRLRSPRSHLLTSACTGYATATRIICLALAIAFATLMAADVPGNLLAGVGTLPLTSTRASSSPLALFSPSATAVATGGYGGIPVAVAATARMDNGWVLVFGNEGVLIDRPASATSGMGKLLLNAVAGLASAQLPVGLVDCDNVKAFLTAQGVAAQNVDASQPQALTGISVLIARVGTFSAPDTRAAVQSWLSSGGVLITAGTAWAWNSPGTTIRESYPLNLLLEPSGICFNDGATDGTAPAQATVPPNPLLNATVAIQALLHASTGGLTDAQLRQASEAVTLAIQSIPAHDVLTASWLQPFANQPMIVPTEAAPIAASDVLARTLVAYQDAVMHALPPEAIRAHPAGNDFPGSVPDAVQHVQVALTIDTSVPDWHGTGLYAPPGALITVTVADPAITLGLRCQIGCHTDTLWQVDPWQRWPAIVWDCPISSSTTTIANPFGGPVYIVVPEGCQATSIALTIAGGVPAPRYILGRTTPADWATQRTLPGPWAEMECDHIILSVSSEVIRTLDDPAPVMQFWDAAVKAEDDLVGWAPAARLRPERLACDRQIAAGYMHSGYPIMTGLDVTSSAVTLDQLRGTPDNPGGWGFWHENGHNHQNDAWTPASQGEVTVNIFSLRIQTLMCGARLNQCWDGNTADAQRAQYIATFNSHPGMKPANWPPEIGLLFYWQLIDSFGWDTMQRVLASYTTNPPTIANDHDRWNEWLKRYSLESRHNLVAFFQAWRIPITADAAAQITGDPWMHPEAPGGPYRVSPWPTMATPIMGPATPITGTTASLTALGGPADREANFTYTWSVVGAPPGGGATFAPNGTHDAGATTATFTAVGIYQVQVVITDSNDGESITSDPMMMTAEPVATTIVVSGPATATIDSTLQFVATVQDQFGATMPGQQNVTWMTSSGTVDGTGLVSAGDTAGTYQVTASVGGQTGSASFALSATSHDGESAPGGAVGSSSSSGGRCGAGAVAGLILCFAVGGCLRFRRQNGGISTV